MENNISNRFVKCIENLLQGRILCHALTPDLYRYLKEENENGECENEDRINVFLTKMGRRLVKTSDEMGYYCCISNYDEGEAKAEGRAFIKKAAHEFEPLIKWLRIIRSCSQDSRPVCADDIIKPSEISHSLEESEILCKMLKDIANSFKVASNSNDISKILLAVIKYLVKEEYLVDANGDGLIYRATAKWSQFYDILEFVKQNEGFDRDKHLDSEQRQTDLFATANMTEVLVPDYSNKDEQKVLS